MGDTYQNIMKSTEGPEVLGALIFLLNKRERSLGMHCPRGPGVLGAGKKCNIEKRRYGFERDARALSLSSPHMTHITPNEE